MTHTFTNTLKFIFISSALVAAAFAFVPTQTHAYFTTHQEATALDNHTGLFFIDYAFGQAKNNIYMPVLAQYTNDHSTATVSYVILDEDGKEVPGKAVGIVFSNATLTSTGMYMTAKNKSTSFRLAVLFTPTHAVAEKKYRLQVTYLPFNFNGTLQLQLNPSELQYYTTPLISL